MAMCNSKVADRIPLRYSLIHILELADQSVCRLTRHTCDDTCCCRHTPAAMAADPIASVRVYFLTFRLFLV